jgi:hypothetical protein
LQLKTEATTFFIVVMSNKKRVGWQNTHFCLGFSWHSSRIWLTKLCAGVLLQVKYFSKFCKWKVTSFTLPRKCKNFQNFLTVECSSFEKVHVLWDVKPSNTALHPRRLESSAAPLWKPQISKGVVRK